MELSGNPINVEAYAALQRTTRWDQQPEEISNKLQTKQVDAEESMVPTEAVANGTYGMYPKHETSTEKTQETKINPFTELFNAVSIFGRFYFNQLL